MTVSSKPSIKYRKDYIPPSHFVDTIDLYIELGEEKTSVTAQSRVRSNAGKTELVLNGRDQVLKWVKINGEELHSNQYEWTSDALVLKNLPEEFDLEIKSEIKPQENTSLIGMYKSNKMFCTQCESEGFRKITYFLDRPDVLSKYTTTIVANKNRYPVLLSNGNLVESGELGKGSHWMKWEDPFKKPSYLFAMVAGDLDCLEDYFVTCSERKIILRIFCEKGYRDQCTFAMTSLKKAMKWDEEKYGREYDLDLFMIVAVSDFNFGAMENKGLNVFNSKYIFAKPEVATDQDYENIDSVVAHEYFHNWTGNRITCRDWFQLSLKEGLTVFRDHTFSEDIGSHAVVRIDEVQCLRTFQFSEDQGPLAHPVRPDSYIEMNNFYTSTVYEKGAEVIRMMRTILGEKEFRSGMDLYFARHDGEAVTCDDFVSAMEEASGVDLTQFKLWYSQAGTPELHVSSEYNTSKNQCTLKVKQICPKTPGQPKKVPMHIPLSIGLLKGNGEEFSLQLLDAESKGSESSTSIVLHVTQSEQSFVFEHITEQPVPSLLRDFSAPVKLFYDYSEKELAFLMVNDTDAFSRWEAGQIYAARVIFQLIEKWRAKEELILPSGFVFSFKTVLQNDQIDQTLIAQMILLPSEVYLAELMDEVDVDGIHVAREFIRKTLVEQLKSEFEKRYAANFVDAPYRFQVEEVAKRSLKNACLSYLVLLSDDSSRERAMQQFKKANNMTDQFAALSVLSNVDCPERKEALQRFYDDWKHEPLVLDKWFAVQARSSLPNTLEEVKTLLKHPDFTLHNPNRIYALLSTFASVNPIHFHAQSGEGYRLVTDQILNLNTLNPQVAARLTKTLTKWKRFDKKRQYLMKEQLERISKEPDLAKDLYEILSKSLT